MFQSDYKKAITAEDLIRRYNLDGLKTDRKLITTFNNSLTRQHTIIKNYITNITPYKGQADRLTAWFFEGVPTLNNKPYTDFTEEEKQERENDLYYDRDSGYAYQYKIGNWEQINDSNLIKSLALADSEPDTSDNKRNTYFGTPSPPYEIGDIWLDGNIIMRCRCARSEGQFNTVDWLTQDEYSNELILKDTRAVLDDFKETITTNYVTKVLLETTVDSINAEVDSKTTKITENINGRFEETNEQISKLNIEIGNINASVQEINTDINGRIDTLSSNLNIEIGKISASVDSKIEDVSGNIQKVEGQLDLYIKKNDTGEVVSAFNLNSNEVVITSDNFKLDAQGNITANNANLHNVNIEHGNIILNQNTDSYSADNAVIVNGSFGPNNSYKSRTTQGSFYYYSKEYNTSDNDLPQFSRMGPDGIRTAFSQIKDMDDYDTKYTITNLGSIGGSFSDINSIGGNLILNGDNSSISIYGKEIFTQSSNHALVHISILDNGGALSLVRKDKNYIFEIYPNDKSNTATFNNCNVNFRNQSGTTISWISNDGAIVSDFTPTASNHVVRLQDLFSCIKFKSITGLDLGAGDNYYLSFPAYTFFVEPLFNLSGNYICGGMFLTPNNTYCYLTNIDTTSSYKGVYVRCSASGEITISTYHHCGVNISGFRIWYLGL